MNARDVILMAAVSLFTLAALTMDLRFRKIPNVLTVPAFLLALLFHGWFDGWEGLKSAGAGFVLGFGTLFLLWLIGGGGAGDVKLMAALGAWLGVRLILYVLVISTAFVAVGSLVFLVVESILRGWGITRRRYLGRFDEQRAKAEAEGRESAVRKWRERRRIMPYALPVGLATWVILAWTFMRHAG